MAEVRYEVIVREAPKDPWKRFRATPHNLADAIRLTQALLLTEHCWAVGVAVLGQTEEPFLWADMNEIHPRQQRRGKPK